MVQDARRAPKDLDLVFIGDSITERWNGTRSWGTESIPGMRKAFEARFTKKGGGTFEAIALGSAGDTVRLQMLHKYLQLNQATYLMILLLLFSPFCRVPIYYGT